MQYNFSQDFGGMPYAPAPAPGAHFVGAPRPPQPGLTAARPYAPRSIAVPASSLQSRSGSEKMFALLEEAVLANNEKAVGRLLSRGAVVTGVNNEGFTILMVAIRNKRSLSLIQQLLSKVSVQDSLNTKHSGETALDMAVASRDKELVKVLISFGADPVTQLTEQSKVFLKQIKGIGAVLKHSQEPKKVWQPPLQPRLHAQVGFIGSAEFRLPPLPDQAVSAPVLGLGSLESYQQTTAEQTQPPLTCLKLLEESRQKGPR